MALIDSYNLSQDATFRNKILVAMTKTAVAVVGEAFTPGNPIRYGKRHVLGVNVLNNLANWLENFVQAAVQDGTLTLGSSDAQIENQLSAVYNDIAGVKITD